MSTTPCTDTSPQGIQAWCRQRMADVLGVPAETIDPAAEFDDLGLDSALAVTLMVDIEEHFGIEVSPDNLFSTPTIHGVAEYVSQQLAEARSA